MKKQLLLAAVLVSAATFSFAEDAPVANTLVAITTDSQYESYEFAYNDNNLVTREDFFVKFSTGDEVGYNEFFYNEKNQLIRNDTYQYKEKEGEFKMSCFVEYTYDEKGRLATRVNYNYFQGQKMLGGLLEYEYDEEDHLIKITSYWDLDKKNLFQIVEFTYENGVNILKTTNFKSFSGSWDTIAKVEMKYDDQKRLIQRDNYEKDANTTDMILRTIIKYEYDDNGLIVKSTQSTSGKEMEREEYFYLDNVPVSDVIYARENENSDRNFLYDACKKALDYSAAYATDQNSGKLALFDLYRYEYAGDPGSGIESVSTDANAFRNLSVIRSGEEAVIRGIERGETVRVYDMAGNLIDSTVANANVYNVSNLTKGTYVLVNGSRVIKFAK